MGASGDAVRVEKPTAGRLVERESELATLGELVELAVAGRGSTALIVGPAGIGKTALHELARRRAAESGLRVLSARGGELERELPWAVARELFTDVLRSVKRDGEADALLEGTAGLARPLLAGDGSGSGGAAAGLGGDALAGLLHGLYWLTSNLAERGPLMLAVDDAHHADPPSLQFLVYLSQRVADLPVLLLAAARPNEPGVDLQPLRTLAAGGRVIQPTPLSESGASRVLGADWGAEPDREFAQACHGLTAGNPFLLHGLAQELERERIAPIRDNARRVQELAPAVIVRAVLLRLAAFPKPAVRLAEAIAVLGTDAPLADAAALAGIDQDDAAAAAADLARADVLAVGMPLNYAHPLIHGVVYEELGAPRRSRLHARAAGVLRARGAPRAEVAVHLLRSEPAGDEAAVEVLREAAAESFAGGFPAGAAELLERALAERPDSEARAAVLVELGEAEAAMGETTALGRLEEALALLTAPRNRAEILLKLAWMWFNAGQLEPARQAFLRGRRELEAAGRELDDAERELAGRLRTGELGTGTLTDEVDLAELESMLEDHERGGTVEARAADRELLTQVALACALSGRDSERVRSLAKRALGDGAMLREAGVTLSFGIAGTCLIWTDAMAEVEAEIDHALALTRERGDTYGEAFVRFGRGWACYWQGRLAEAAADAETAARAWSTGGQLAGQLAAARYWLAAALLELDEVEQAERALGGEVPGWEERDRLFWRLGRARLAMARGEAAAARQQLEAVEASARRIPFFGSPVAWSWRSDAALAAAKLGDGDGARRLVDEELELTRRFGAPRQIAIALRAAGIVTGGKRGIELLAESVATLEDSPSRLELCRSLVELGAAMRRSGAPGQAKEPLSSALELGHELGARALERRARQELVAAGSRPRRPMLTGPEALTPSELRVCQLAVDGLANREIAERLFVSLRTVETHLTRGYAKLGITSRAGLEAALGDRAEPVAEA